MIRIKKIFPGILPAPIRASEDAAGYDLSATHDITLFPHCTELIPTGYAWEIPPRYVGLIRDRSSLALAGLVTSAGVIDSDYRGEVKVLLTNTTNNPITIRAQQRIAQILLVKVLQEPLAVVQQLSTSHRQEGGFGSTNP